MQSPTALSATAFENRERNASLQLLTPELGHFFSPSGQQLVQSADEDLQRCLQLAAQLAWHEGQPGAVSCVLQAFTLEPLDHNQSTRAASLFSQQLPATQYYAQVEQRHVLLALLLESRGPAPQSISSHMGKAVAGVLARGGQAGFKAACSLLLMGSQVSATQGGARGFQATDADDHNDNDDPQKAVLG